MNNLSHSCEWEEGQMKNLMEDRTIGLITILSFVVYTVFIVYIVTPQSVDYRTPGRRSSQRQPTKKVEKKKASHRKKIRLPHHVYPVKYDVQLRPLFDDLGTIEGDVKIVIKSVHNGKSITLHMLDIQVLHPPEVCRMDGKKLGIKETEEDKNAQFYIIHLRESLEKNQRYTLHVRFRSKLNEKLEGFYKSSYKTSTGETRLLATTHFEASHARRAFPCFDEPDFKAKFKVILGRKSSMHSASNMKISTTIEDENNPGWMWDTYEESPVMPTYLLAFIISDLEKKCYPGRGTRQCSIYARAQAIQNNEADYAGSIMGNVLQFFEDYYDVPYPLSKLDMAAVPDFAHGGMENWGLITYRQSSLLYNPSLSSASNKMNVARVVSHEIAHQWFGNLVTPVWWTDLWLNEGFATYMQFYGVHQVEPTWNMPDVIVSIHMHFAMKLDALKSSHAISIPVSDPDEIAEIFDEISYLKAACIVRMMAYFLGHETFRIGISRYLKKFKYSNAEQDDLWNCLTEQSQREGVLPDNLSVKKVMDTWTLQAGYPVLTVTRTADGRSAVFSQKRFMLTEGTPECMSASWFTPITYTTKKEKDFSIENTKPVRWLKKDEQSYTAENIIDDSSDWLLVNIHASGFYRVNYDLENWCLLSQQLNTDHTQIPAIERTKLLDDAFNLALAKQIPYSAAMAMTEYLKNEDDYLPLKSALAELRYIDEMLNRTSGYGQFKEFMNNLISPLYKKIDSEYFSCLDTSYKNINDVFKNISIMETACHINNEEAIHVVKELFRKFKDNYDLSQPDKSEHQIPPDLKDVVYVNSIKYGSEEDWYFLWRHYELTSMDTEKEKVLRALGSCRHVWLLSSFLEKLLDESSGIRKQDCLFVIYGVTRHPLGSHVYWDFFRNKFSTIREKLGESYPYYGRMIEFATESFNTEFQESQVREFLQTHEKDLQSAKRAGEQALEKIGANTRWMEQNYDNILNWLKEANGRAKKAKTIAISVQPFQLEE